MEINENTQKSETFDKSAEYSAEIIPLMHKLEEACERIGIPYLVHVVFLENDEGIGCGTLMNGCGKSGYGATQCEMLGNMAANEISGESMVKAAIAAGLAAGIIQRGGR